MWKLIKKLKKRKRKREKILDSHNEKLEKICNTYIHRYISENKFDKLKIDKITKSQIASEKSHEDPT